MKPKKPRKITAPRKPPSQIKISRYLKTSITPALVKEICHIVEAGNFPDVAAAYFGVSPHQFSSWLSQGRKLLRRYSAGERISLKEEPYILLIMGLQKATAKAEIDGISTINSHSESDWKAAAWKLARLAPERWGESTEVNVNAKIESTTETTHKITIADLDLPPEALREALLRIRNKSLPEEPKTVPLLSSETV